MAKIISTLIKAGLAPIVIDLIKQVVADPENRAHLKDALTKLGDGFTSLKPASKTEKLERKLTAIEEYAADYATQYPESTDPKDWEAKVRHLRARVLLTNGMDGKKKKRTLADLGKQIDALLADAMTDTAERLEKEKKTEDAEA